jgi:hypothetical protein
VLQQITKDNFNLLLGQFSTKELENLVGKFPYFQQAHVLLAKKYQQENNPSFDEQLQLAALYTQDRELLFALFNQRDVSPVYEPSVVILPSPIELPKEEAAEQEIGVVSEEDSFEVVVSTQEIVAAQEEEIVEVFVETKEDISSPQIEENIQAEEPVVEVKEVFIVNQPHTFGEWLTAFNKVDIVKQEEVIAPPPSDDLAEPDKELEQLYLSNLPLQELVEEETHYSKGLERFIEEQKLKHKPQGIKTANENDLAPELITETMARVYEAQKKYAKAIRAYEILAMRYPEKNDFFAARISELKTNI